MSNSNDTIKIKSYLVALSLSSLFLLLASLTFTWILDPLGVLKERRGFPSLCANGIKTPFDQFTTPLLEIKTHTTELIIGTSRIRRGFTNKVAEEYLTNYAINLSMSGIRMEEIQQLLMPIINKHKIKKIWIGLDYGMFISSKREFKRINPIPHGAFNTFQIYQHGLFSANALKASFFSFFYESSCNNILRDTNGFEPDINSSKPLISEKKLSSQEAHLIALFSTVNKDKNKKLYRERMQILDSLLQESTKHNIKINLFINPSHPYYFEALEKTRATENFSNWVNEIENTVSNLSGKSNIKFKNFSESSVLGENIKGVCKKNLNQKCPFYDITHYKSEIAQKIIESFSKE